MIPNINESAESITLKQVQKKAIERIPSIRDAIAKLFPLFFKGAGF